MSFILDALKKSEQERERQRAPIPVELPYGQRNRGQPLWLWIVVGLLVVNCVLLLVMWWRGSQPDAVPVANAPTSATNNAVSSAASTQGNTGPALVNSPPRASEVRPLQAEAGEDAAPPADETAAALANDEPADDAPLVKPLTGLERAVKQQEAQALANRNRDQRTASPSASTSNAVDGTPTLASLGGNGALNLPDLRLDVHVYSSVATERFAFINGHKYVEGQTLAEGPHLERIVQDGVVLSYRNQRFLLPRQ